MKPPSTGRTVIARPQRQLVIAREPNKVTMQITCRDDYGAMLLYEQLTISAKAGAVALMVELQENEANDLQTENIVVDRVKARKLYRKYRAHQHYSKPIGKEIQRTYQLIAQVDW